MKSTETSPSAHVLKKSQPEEFDLVILGGGTGSTIAAWTFAAEGKRVAVVDRKYIGDHVRTLHVYQAKTSFTVQRSRRISAEARNLALLTMDSPLICREFVSANATWFPG